MIMMMMMVMMIMMVMIMMMTSLAHLTLWLTLPSSDDVRDEYAYENDAGDYNDVYGSDDGTLQCC